MTYEYKAVITDEIPTMRSVVVRTWLTKEGSDKTDERAFILPVELKLTDDNPLQMLLAAVDRTYLEMMMEKNATKKPRRAVQKEKVSEDGKE